MHHALEAEEAGIVLVGSFNPAIFQPSWLASRKLIRETESERATDLVVTEQVTSFKAGWLRIQVMRERFAASAENAAHFEALLDLVLGIFSLLEHTPIKAMGLNRLAHYRLDSDEDWHKLGDTLAPKKYWEELLSVPSDTRGLPGMRSITIEGRRPGSQAKHVRIKVEPSRLVTPHGVYFETNEHYAETAESPVPAPAPYLDILKSSWADALSFAQRAAAHMLDRIG